jgi:CelD/BcsL family acetyltransferase involved in cellulose biosynthesis
MAPSEVSCGVDLSYSVEAVTTEEGLLKLQDDWNRLSATAEHPNVFTTFDWFRAWNQCFTQKDRSGRQPHVLVVKKDGGIAGILPLISRTASRFAVTVRKLEFVGSEGDYNDLVLGNDPPGQIDAVVDFLTRTQDQWDLIELKDLRDTGNSMALVEGALSRARLVYRLLPEEEKCPYLPIDAPSSVIVSRLSQSKSRRMDGLHTLRKKQHRLERLSAAGLRVRIIENPFGEPGLVEKLIALERQKRVHGKLSPPFIANYPQVFQSLFDTLGPHGWFCIGLMEMGERPIGSRLVFRCGKKLWDFLTAYDHTFSRLSPGTMLVSALVDYGFSHGFDEFDFMRGVESYKMQWTTQLHQSHRLLIWSRRWASRARAFVYLDLKPAVYSLVGKGE